MAKKIISNNRSLFALLALIVASLPACRGGDRLPDVSSAEYRAAVRAFYTGVTAMQTGEEVRAEERLTEVTRLVPQEPAAWANLGLLALRQRELDVAAERLERARTLAPDNGQIYVLLGMVESNRGRFDAAISHLRRAIELDPQNLKASFTLAQELERQGGETNEAESQRLLAKMLESQPYNLAVLLELTRLAAKRGDSDALRDAVARLVEVSGGWPTEAKEQLAQLQTAASGESPRLAATRVAFLRNVLVRVPEFRRGLAAVQTPREQAGDLITEFLRLPSPEPAPSPPDLDLAFSAEPISAAGDARGWAGAISLDAESSPLVITASGREVRLPTGNSIPFPGGAQTVAPAPNGVASLDFNYDFKTDLALAGAGGLRLYRQDDKAAFTDVTSRAALPASLTGRSFTAAWAADIDLDGDLDIVLGVRDGAPPVIRNNGDGTFKELRPFESVAGLGGFAWADLDGDGDPDAALIDQAGGLHVFSNERSGQFLKRGVPEGIGSIAALSVADTNGDAILDIIALFSDGRIQSLADKDEGKEWELIEITRLPDAGGGLAAASAGLFVADLDNNGGLDLAARSQAGTRIWLSDAEGRFQPLAAPLDARVFSIADTNGDGRLDLVGLSREGQPVRIASRGAKDYNWQVIRTRAAVSTGDQRINSFGVGGEIEIRTGLLFQKQPVTGPVTHFGLGDHAGTDLVRIIWPNGSVQGEYELQADQSVLAEQRLKGSCPFVFAYDGEQMRFVTDFLWRSPLGLRINAQNTASVSMTEDRIKIRGDQLAPRDGFYDIRVTADLWETHYWDHVSLMVVDHPAGTDIFIDERFAVPPPSLAFHTVSSPRPIARAWDDQGQDVTDIVRSRDARYLDTFGRGAYQGVTRDHFVEIELGQDAPYTAGLWLVAHGWVHPTDSSINVALSQGSHPPPRGLSIEVPDGRGGWAVAKSDLGFPAGKNKTVLLSLDGLFKPGVPRRLRLRTNLEVFWDSIEWAAGVPDVTVKTLRLEAETAELRFRGFSIMSQADISSPELPEYKITGTAQRWFDLIGYYTRFGDVRELISKVDDRYVIANAGDEMALRFRAPDAPPEGWVRDFVLIGDGWNKDGDYNTTFSKTVLPLPSHDRPDYTSVPGRLEEDPIYRRHARDWQEYHTRYITPEDFRSALITRKRQW